MKKKELIVHRVPCDCGAHAVVLQLDDGNYSQSEYPPMVYLDFWYCGKGWKPGLWQRIKNAWWALTDQLCPDSILIQELPELMALRFSVDVMIKRWEDVLEERKAKEKLN